MNIMESKYLKKKITAVKKLITQEIFTIILWAYCIDKNIQALGACRGEPIIL